MDTVSQQLYQLSVGTIHQLNIKAVGSAMLSAEIGFIPKLPQSLQMPLSELNNAIIAPLIQGERLDIDRIVAKAMGSMAGTAVGSAIGQTLEEQLKRLDENYGRSQLSSVNNKAMQPQRSREQSNQQKLDQLAQSSRETTQPNQSRAKRLQQSVASTDKWQAWEKRVSDNLFKEINDSFNPKLQLKKAPDKPVENWQKATAVRARNDHAFHQADFTNNPNYKPIVGLNGQVSYLDKRGNIYVRMAEGGIRKIEDPGVESIHPEDFLLGGLEIAVAKGALLAGGKFVEVMSPELAALGAKVLTGTKGLGEIAFGKLASGLGLWAKGGNIISASLPNEIAWGYGPVSRQASILERLPDEFSSIKLHKTDISVTDLAALTAKIGDEFAMFTRGSQRLVIRGNPQGINLTEKILRFYKSQSFKWSAHTHPGTSDLVLNASGTPGDRYVLRIFGQDRSLILNSAGRRNVFDMTDNLYISKTSKEHNFPELKY